MLVHWMVLERKKKKKKPPKMPALLGVSGEPLSSRRRRCGGGGGKKKKKRRKVGATHCPRASFLQPGEIIFLPFRTWLHGHGKEGEKGKGKAQ